MACYEKEKPDYAMGNVSNEKQILSKKVKEMYEKR